MGIIPCSNSSPLSNSSLSSLSSFLKSSSSPLITSLNKEFTSTLHFSSISTPSHYTHISSSISKQQKLSQFTSLFNLYITSSSLFTSTNIETSIINSLILYKQSSPSQFHKLLLYNTINSIRLPLWEISTFSPHTTYTSFKQKQNSYMKQYNTILSNTAHMYIDIEIQEQIKKDITRTFFDFEIHNNNSLQKLYNILLVFSIFDKEVGYCQGINFITKFLLELTSYNESLSFWLLIYICNNIRGFFLNEFPLLISYLSYFDYLFKQILPSLYHHFTSLDIPHEVWAGKYIQTLFTMSTSYDILCKLFDSIFSFGFEFVLFVILSIVDIYKEELLMLSEGGDVIEFLKDVMMPIQEETKKRKDVNIMDVIENAMKIYKKWYKKEMFEEVKRKICKEKGIELEEIERCGCEYEGSGGGDSTYEGSISESGSMNGKEKSRNRNDNKECNVSTFKDMTVYDEFTYEESGDWKCGREFHVMDVNKINMKLK